MIGIREFGMESALARLRGLGTGLKETARVAAKSIVGDMTRHVTTEKMTHSNPPYLNRRTGTGVRSVTASQRVTDRGQGVVGSFGTNLGYIIKHEEGFEGNVTVPAHTRKRTRVSARVVNRLARSTGYSAADLKDTLSNLPISVRQHTRHVVTQARHFMAHTLAERTPEANRRYRRAVYLLATTGKVPNINSIAQVD